MYRPDLRPTVVSGGQGRRWVEIDPKLDAYASRRSTPTPVVVLDPRNPRTAQPDRLSDDGRLTVEGDQRPGASRISQYAVALFSTDRTRSRSVLLPCRGNSAEASGVRVRACSGLPSQVATSPAR